MQNNPFPLSRTINAYEWQLKCVWQFCSIFLLVVVVALSAAVTRAESFEAGSIRIIDPFSRALPASSHNGAVYLTLMNHGNHSDKLIGVSTSMAEHAEIHTHRMEDGMMKMSKLEQIELLPHEEVVFAPGGNHIMLIGLSQPLKQGDYFPLMLNFKKVGYVSVDVEVKAVDAISTSSHKYDHGSTSIEVHVSIEDGKVAGDHRVIRVTHEDNVTIHFSSDEIHQLHIHGYDIKVNVGPESHSVVNFKAKATGRFPAEIHGSDGHHKLFYVEVYPK